MPLFRLRHRRRLLRRLMAKPAILVVAGILGIGLLIWLGQLAFHSRVPRAERLSTPREISIIDNGFELRTLTTRPSVGEVLRDSHIDIFPEDYVVPDLDQRIPEDSTIYIDRATTISITNFLGESHEVRTRSHTVAELMTEIGFVPKEDERIDPAPETILVSNLEVTMLHMSSEEFEQDVSIPFDVEYIEDDSMAYNQEEIQQAGRDGTKKEIYALSYENSELVDKTLISTEVLEEPQTKIIVIGTLLPEGSTEIGSGVASFYGRAFDGRRTASGEVFDKDGLTAAHPDLPFGTLVKVTNVANGESVVVKITDRGPYSEGRVIDLSEAAFDAIASLSTGVIKVQLTVIK